MTDKLRINLSGLSEELAQDVEERILEFEKKHEASLLNGGAGWVLKIRGIDYSIAIAVNAVIVLWLVVVFLGR